jgi:hypothetical protein
MSNFRIFEVDKKKAFLAKAKDNKAKKEQEVKKNADILVIQKNIRAFLCATCNAGPKYPLFIRTAEQVQTNRDFVESLWDSLEKQPNLLKKKVLTLTIKSLKLDIPLEVKA